LPEFLENIAARISFSRASHVLLDALSGNLALNKRRQSSASVVHDSS